MNRFSWGWWTTYLRPILQQGRLQKMGPNKPPHETHKKSRSSPESPRRQQQQQQQQQQRQQQQQQQQQRRLIPITDDGCPLTVWEVMLTITRYPSNTTPFSLPFPPFLGVYFLFSQSVKSFGTSKFNRTVDGSENPVLWRNFVKTPYS